jgi:hypothetical protein
LNSFPSVGSALAPQARISRLYGALIPKQSRRIAAIILSHKIAFAIFLGLIPKLFAPLFELRPTTQTLTVWDIDHYLFIAKYWYLRDSNHCAFYPLWPICLRPFALLAPNATLLWSWLLSNIFSFFALVMFHRMIHAKHSLRLATSATLLLLFYPGSLFLCVPYSESLFLLLIICFFRSLDVDNIRTTIISSFLLPLTRAIGIFVLPVLVWDLLKKRSSLPRFAICLVPLLGYLFYFALIWFSTGNPFEGFAAQQSFPAQPSVSRIFDLSGFCQRLFHFSYTHDQLYSFIDRAVFLTLVASLYHIFRFDTSYYVYSLCAGLIPALSNGFMSYTRFATLVFPIFIVGGQLCLKTRTLPLLLILSYGVQIMFLLLFISGRWAG